jgi:hypothetical protein
VKKVSVWVSRCVQFLDNNCVTLEESVCLVAGQKERIL